MKFFRTAPVLIGVAAGIGCVPLSSRYLRPFVYAIEPTDAPTLAIVSLTFIAWPGQPAICPPFAPLVSIR